MAKQTDDVMSWEVINGVEVYCASGGVDDTARDVAKELLSYVDKNAVTVSLDVHWTEEGTTGCITITS